MKNDLTRKDLVVYSYFNYWLIIYYFPIIDNFASPNLEYKEYQKDQMVVLDSLAAYFLQEGRRVKDKDKKRELFTKATQLYTTADKINMLDQVRSL